MAQGPPELLLALISLGGLGAGIAAARMGQSEVVARIVLGAAFANALVTSVLLGFGLNEAFSDAMLRRYPLSAVQRVTARHLTAPLDPRDRGPCRAWSLGSPGLAERRAPVQDDGSRMRRGVGHATIATKRCPSGFTAYERPKPRMPPAPAADVVACVASQGFVPLDITLLHAQRAGSLASSHRDPFDRMLVAQSQIEDVALVTDDEVFEQFDVRRFW